MSLPDGFVDPLDESAVADVLARVHRTMGVDGVLDLLGRLPGVRLEPATPKRFLSPAVPASVWLGAEIRLRAEPAPVLDQVVGGIVLHTTALTPGDLPTRLAGPIADLTREQASYDEVSAALTAARGVTDSF